MIEISSSSSKRDVLDAISRRIMRWQDATQAYDEAVGERLELNGAERRCLSFLYGGPQPAGAIATAVGLTPAAVTALIDRLEKRGFVRRMRSVEDRRVVMVETTEGVAQLTKVYYLPLAEEGEAQLSNFTKADLLAVLRFLTVAVDVQEKYLAALEDVRR
jgi:DNA-binding MarR family transcriptional regulator